MKALISIAGLLVAAALTACADTSQAPETADNAPPAEKTAPAGPPPFPVYVMRDQVSDGDRLNSVADGANLFSNRCGSCHLDFGMGTNVLTARRVKQGFPPESGLLANRTDLTAAYVKTVVRHGLRGMPRITRVDVTDSELERIAAYLEGANP